jgi:tryptophan synthase alpha chain
MHALVEAGADVIELGCRSPTRWLTARPSSGLPSAPWRGHDPAQGAATGHHFRTVDDRTPVVLMGYANPIEAMGLQRLPKGCAVGRGWRAGGRLPAGGGRKLWRRHEGAGLDPIFLIAPTSNAERIAQVAQIASGYVYYVSLAGVTGSGALNVDAVAERLPAIREKTGLPVGVGLASAMPQRRSALPLLPMPSSSAAGLSKKLKNRPQKPPAPTSRRWWRIFVAVWMR